MQFYNSRISWFYIFLASSVWRICPIWMKAASADVLTHSQPSTQASTMASTGGCRSGLRSSQETGLSLNSVSSACPHWTGHVPPPGHGGHHPQLQSPKSGAASAALSGCRRSSPGCRLSPAWTRAAAWGLDPGDTWAAQCCCWSALGATFPPEAFWAAQRRTQSWRNTFRKQERMKRLYLAKISNLERSLPCGWEPEAPVSWSELQRPEAPWLLGGLQRALVFEDHLPPIYTPTFPCECVGRRLPGASHTLSQSQSRAGQWALMLSKPEGQLFDFRGTGKRLEEEERGGWGHQGDCCNQKCCINQWLELSKHSSELQSFTHASIRIFSKP